MTTDKSQTITGGSQTITGDTDNGSIFLIINYC